MGASNAVVGPGFTLKVSDAGGTVYTAIAEIHDINGPGMKTKMVSVFNQQSPGKAEEQKPSKITVGDITFDISYVPTETTHNAIAGLLSLQQNGLRRNYQITNPHDAVVWSVAAYVSAFAPKWPEEDKLIAAVTLSVDGPATIA
jgi:hypothetical protein